MTLKGEVENAARAFLKTKTAWVAAHRDLTLAKQTYESRTADQNEAATELQRAIGFTAEDRRKGTGKTKHIMVGECLLRVVANLDGAGAVSIVEYDS